LAPLHPAWYPDERTALVAWSESRARCTTSERRSQERTFSQYSSMGESPRQIEESWRSCPLSLLVTQSRLFFLKSRESIPLPVPQLYVTFFPDPAIFFPVKIEVIRDVRQGNLRPPSGGPQPVACPSDGRSLWKVFLFGPGIAQCFPCEGQAAPFFGVR